VGRPGPAILFVAGAVLAAGGWLVSQVDKELGRLKDKSDDQAMDIAKNGERLSVLEHRADVLGNMHRGDHPHVRGLVENPTAPEPGQ